MPADIPTIRVTRRAWFDYERAVFATMCKAWRESAKQTFRNAAAAGIGAAILSLFSNEPALSLVLSASLVGSVAILILTVVFHTCTAQMRLHTQSAEKAATDLSRAQAETEKLRRRITTIDDLRAASRALGGLFDEGEELARAGSNGEISDGACIARALAWKARVVDAIPSEKEGFRTCVSDAVLMNPHAPTRIKGLRTLLLDLRMIMGRVEIFILENSRSNDVSTLPSSSRQKHLTSGDQERPAA